jgi:hypothetical protein
MMGTKGNRKNIFSWFKSHKAAAAESESAPTEPVVQIDDASPKPSSNFRRGTKISLKNTFNFRRFSVKTNASTKDSLAGGGLLKRGKLLTRMRKRGFNNKIAEEIVITPADETQPAENVKSPEEELREKQIMTLTNLTQMDYETVKHIVDKFSNENGKCELNKEQFVKFYAALREEPISRLNSIAKFAFNSFDSDGSGTIDINEFIVSMAIFYFKFSNLQKKLSIEK